MPQSRIRLVRSMFPNNLNRISSLEKEIIHKMKKIEIDFYHVKKELMSMPPSFFQKSKLDSLPNEIALSIIEKQNFTDKAKTCLTSRKILNLCKANPVLMNYSAFFDFYIKRNINTDTLSFSDKILTGAYYSYLSIPAIYKYLGLVILYSIQKDDVALFLAAYKVINNDMFVKISNFFESPSTIVNISGFLRYSILDILIIRTLSLTKPKKIVDTMRGFANKYIEKLRNDDDKDDYDYQTDVYNHIINSSDDFYNSNSRLIAIFLFKNLILKKRYKIQDYTLIQEFVNLKVSPVTFRSAYLLEALGFVLPKLKFSYIKT